MKKICKSVYMYIYMALVNVCQTLAVVVIWTLQIKYGRTCVSLIGEKVSWGGDIRET